MAKVLADDIVLSDVGVEEYDGSNSSHPDNTLTVSPSIATECVKITYHVTQQTSNVSIKICDANGRIVKDLLLPAAYSLLPTTISWDARDNAGHRVPKGIYFVALECKSDKKAVKVLLIE